MKVAIIGSGPTGLLLGAALADRGHDVATVDRDPGPRADGGWRRRGVMQFEHAHGFRPQVGRALARHWPEGLAAWRSAGAEPIVLDVPGLGEVAAGHRSRRSTFERGLRVAAGDVAGLELRTGHVDRILEEGGRAVGVQVDGARVEADLVVDASGRSGLARHAADGRLEGLCGMAYVDRTFRLRAGAEPGPMDNPVALVREYDGYQVLVFLHERRHFSVLFVRPTADDDLKDLRHTAAFDAACAAVPDLAAWTDPALAAPTSPVLVGGALRNTYRPQRGLPGLVTVGDAVATTTPTRGRGIAMAYTQAEALLGLLDDGADAATVAEPFGAWCDTQIRPWVDDHIAIDTEAVARWQGADVDLARPLTSDAVCVAAEVDPRIAGIAGPFFAMEALPAVLAEAEPLARAVYATGWRRPLPAGPTRDELVDVVRRALAGARARG
ncbi:MAG: FAD-dependent monooxygenase [Nocardioidaceae bacterium]